MVMLELNRFILPPTISDIGLNDADIIHRKGYNVAAEATTNTIYSMILPGVNLFSVIIKSVPFAILWIYIAFYI